MTFEERIERLTERHKALTLFLEHLAIESDKHTKQLEIDGQFIRELTRTAETAHEGISALRRISKSHERQITHIDRATPEA
jgi:hypothetical protein